MMPNIINLLLPLLLQFLPMILNKPKAEADAALKRKWARYNAAATNPNATSAEQVAFGEVADLCLCLVAADDAGRDAIVNGIQQAHDGVLAMAGAMAAAQGAAQ